MAETKEDPVPDSVFVFVLKTHPPQDTDDADPNNTNNHSLLVHSATGTAVTKVAATTAPDPRDHAIETLREKVGLSTIQDSWLHRMFAFRHANDGGDHQHKVVFEYHVQEEDHHPPEPFVFVPAKEVHEKVKAGSTEEIVAEKEDELALRLYLQRHQDLRLNRRLLHGYSGSDLDQYSLRPKPKVVFFDCDDCLYFDDWTTAKRLTKKIDTWCINHGLPPGKAYELYKKYGTALRGLRAENYLEDTEEATDRFLKDVHDISVDETLQPDPQLRDMILRMDPSIPRYIFTASVRHHAERCLRALGIDDLFVDIIDCKRCDLETKHSPHSFRTAMRVANVDEPESCLFLDDSTKNIQAAREIGWRSVLVGTIGRDCGTKIGTDHAELEIDRIHQMEHVLPELF